MAGFFTWIKSPTDVARDFNEFVQTNIIDRIDHKSTRFADQMTQWMRDNAPWEDRTGDARAGLHVVVERNATNFTFTLAHGVDYGIFLETMQAGRFAILTPAVLYFSGKTTDLVKAGE